MKYMLCLVFIFRFYIESIAYLKDNATIELFYLQAKQSVYKVRLWQMQKKYNNWSISPSIMSIQIYVWQYLNSVYRRKYSILTTKCSCKWKSWYLKN